MRILYTSQFCVPRDIYDMDLKSVKQKRHLNSFWGNTYQKMNVTLNLK